MDLNADLGEGFGAWRLGDDEALLSVVTSANVACGFHAGDAVTMRRVCEWAADRGVAVGAQVDSGAYESTQTGTFRVHNKIAGLQYDAPYKTYISDWVGFDAARANGFHSLLKDATGNVVDAGTGRISNGCIRVGDSAAIFAYAEIGMVVYVHH